MKKYINLKLDLFVYMGLAVFFLILPASLYLPPEFGYENGLIENMQMIILILSCCLVIKSKERKTFFNLILMILIILILREINCGRTLFFPIPGQDNAFYSWKEIPYGWLAHPLYGIYIAATVIYGFIYKFWTDLQFYITKTKIPIWNTLLLVSGIVLSLLAEKMTENFVFEEMSELLMYVSILGIVYMYSQKKYAEV